MSQPVVTVRADAPLDQVVATMERHQLRRVPVVDRQGLCEGIIAQADVALTSREREIAHLVREVGRCGSVLRSPKSLSWNLLHESEAPLETS